MVHTSLSIIDNYYYNYGYEHYKNDDVITITDNIVAITVAPKPYSLWTKAHYNAIFPLVLVFSFGWSFEMMTHLEGNVLNGIHTKEPTCTYPYHPSPINYLHPHYQNSASGTS